MIKQVWTKMIHNIEKNLKPWIGFRVSLPALKLAIFERFKSKLNESKASVKGFGSSFEFEMSEKS